jgi:phage-related protein
MTAVIPFSQSPMGVFAWTPDDAFVTSEKGLFHSRVRFGQGYSQVSYKGIARSWKLLFYKGIARSWKLLFWSQGDYELSAIAGLINSRKPFLWTQFPPHESEGQHPTRGNVSHSSENNGRITRLECKFDVDLIGSQFAQEASKKYRPRDGGMIRD